MLLAKTIAELRQQRIMGHTGNVTDINQMGLSFAPRRTNRNKMNLGLTASPHSHRRLGVDLVTSVNDSVHAIGNQR